MKVKIFMAIMALCLTMAVSAQNKSNSTSNSSSNSSSSSNSASANSSSKTTGMMNDGNMNACHAIMMDGMTQEQMMEYMAKNMNNGMMSTCPMGMGQNNTSGTTNTRK